MKPKEIIVCDTPEDKVEVMRHFMAYFSLASYSSWRTSSKLPDVNPTAMFIHAMQYHSNKEAKQAISFMDSYSLAYSAIIVRRQFDSLESSIFVTKHTIIICLQEHEAAYLKLYNTELLKMVSNET